MNLSQIKTGSTIIAPSYLHPYIRKAMLTHTNGIAGIQLCSLHVWLNIKENKTAIYEYYTQIKKLVPHLKYNQKTAASYSFLQETKNFITHLKQAGIKAEAIQCSNPFMEELKAIITHLYPIPLGVDTIHQKFEKALSKPLNQVYIIDEYCDIHHADMYKQMEKQGATRIHFTPKLIHKEYYYVLNKRQEVESLAQYIVAHQIPAEDCTISLMDSGYQGYVKQIFQRYHIPCSFVSDTNISLIHTKYMALLQYLQQPNHENALELLQRQVLYHPANKQCMDYMKLYELDFHDAFHIIDNLQITNEVVDQKEIEALSKLENKAQEVQQLMLNELALMETCTTMDEKLCAIDAFLVRHHSFQSKEDRNALLQIRQEIQYAHTYLKEKADLDFLLSVLSSHRVSLTASIKGCMISDFTHPLVPNTYHFVLGCTQENYPAFTPFSGIYEEKMHQSAGYPSLESRYQLHVSQFEKYLSATPSLICFYPISTFDGKAHESSLELDAFMGEASRYYPIHNYIPIKRKYTIHAEEAKQLYLKDHTLYGSISSLERYASCPYSYFLRYGLHLEEPQDYSFSNAKAGTLSHHVMELLVQTHGKDYVQTKEEEIRAILESKLEELRAIYPNKMIYLQQMEKRLLASIMENLQVLNEHESHSSLHSFLCEQHFSHEFTLPNQIKLKLRGIIDRIDMNDDFFRIIDYKSSPKTIREDYVFSALQLQLITYLVMMEKKLGKRALGAFYYSMANPNINMIHTKLSKRPLGYKTFTVEEGLAYQTKEKKVSGWITNEYIEVMDDDGSHTKGVRNSKASGISTSTIYNSETLYSYIEAIYQSLANQILSGDIGCESVSGACTYCPYVQVCANANHNVVKEERIEVDASLYLKGGRKNA